MRYNNWCIPCNKCPQGRFCNWKNRNCAPCDKNCKRCDKTSTTCEFPCKPGFIWHKFKCVPSCPVGFFSFGFTDKGFSHCDIKSENCMCGQCHDTCKTCTGSKADQCIKCKKGYLLTEKGECVKVCPRGTYQCEEACRDCH